MPVIVLTGRGGVASCKEAIRGGVFDYIEKPMEPKTLLERVAHAIRWDAQRFDMRRRLKTLTERERQVMQMILQCYSVKQIAHELGVSFQTAARHRARLFEKLGVESDAELISRLTWLTSPAFVSQEPAVDTPYAGPHLPLEPGQGRAESAQRGKAVPPERTAGNTTAPQSHASRAGQPR